MRASVCFLWKICCVFSLENRKVKSKKRKLNDDEDDLENEYEDRADKETSKQVIRNLLPIKTKDKIIPQTMVKEEGSHKNNIKNFYENLIYLFCRSIR